MLLVSTVIKMLQASVMATNLKYLIIQVTEITVH